jgi:hypothetical protein
MIHVVLNIFSACFGVAGTVLIFLYGIPKKIDTGGAPVYTAAVDQNEKNEIARYKRNGNLGLFCILFSFIFQLGDALISIFLPEHLDIKAEIVNHEYFDTANKITNTAESTKTVYTQHVESISKNITDDNCRQLIPPTYQITLTKGISQIKEIKISDYLTLRDDHELIPNPSAITGNDKKVYIFTANVWLPRKQKMQTVSGVSFFKYIPGKGVAGYFVIDGFCQAQFERSI